MKFSFQLSRGVCWEFVYTHTQFFWEAMILTLLDYLGHWYMKAWRCLGCEDFYDLFKLSRDFKVDTGMRRCSQCDEFQTMIFPKGCSFPMNFTLAKCFQLWFWL